ncbi:MAG: response regulator [Butyricicoccus porcorum]|nr:response regulator [Butyricicoccus porcorum]MDD6985829.1 response regulator [Butyricicoccus porcorum]MDY4484227.1 response regulator [Butyricicoccus porcorum]
MDKTFLIIDDDPAVCKMLELLIRSNGLGRVVCVLHSGESAAGEVLFYQPDIVLLDMVLPVTGGVTIVRQLVSSGFAGKCVMLSQISDRQMISRAYEAGILFFLNKPINAIEVVSVLRSAMELVHLKQTMNTIRSTVLSVPDESQNPQPLSIEAQLSDIFRDLGLIGTAGIEDIQAVLLKIIAHRRESREPYQLKEIYSAVCQSRGKDSDAAQRALEQRIRRTIQKSLSTIAQIGCADYYDSVFTEYAALLFDFRQVQQEMKHIRSPREEQGKINTKKFMEGILSRITV